ncbi:MAG: chemotaxis protein CheW [Bacillota bacterium]|nr:chemotaxis protein CheW [Bacillota bacterium]NLV62040.1 purine-binding chemotaxis protein CheW [Clostridiaceae bacterium]
MKKVLTFYLRDILFGIDVTIVKEINRKVDYTSVPGAKSDIVGLYNMRGQVVTLFDIAGIMGFQKKEPEEKVSCVILKALPNDPNQAGFIIDGFGDVLEIEQEEFEPPPANVVGVDGEYIKSIVKLAEQLLIMVNTDKLFA